MHGSVLVLLCLVLGAARAALASDEPPGPPPRPLGADLPVVTAPEDPSAVTAGTFEEPTGEITLRDALALALLHHPGLAAESWEVRVREAQAVQAAVRPNPDAVVEFENFGGSGGYGGTGASETTLLLSQLFEIGGKRGRRRDAAEAETSLAGWDFEQRRLDVLTATARSFVDVVIAQERVILAGELVSVAEEGLKTVARRVAAGGVSPVEETRARVALASSRLERRQTERQLAEARIRLASQWGSAAPRFTMAIGELQPTPPPPDREELFARAERNPEVARWGTELEQREADVALQRALGRLDLTLAGGVRHLAETSNYAFVVGVEVPLPLSDRNQGETRAAEYRLARVRDEERAARAAVHAAVALAHEVALAAHGELVVLDEEILPDAREALATVEDTYRRGRFSLTDVLDTRRTLFELQDRRLQALLEYYQARTELERLVGEPLATERSR